MKIIRTKASLYLLCTIVYLPLIIGLIFLALKKPEKIYTHFMIAASFSILYVFLLYSHYTSTITIQDETIEFNWIFNGTISMKISEIKEAKMNLNGKQSMQLTELIITPYSETNKKTITLTSQHYNEADLNYLLEILNKKE